MEASIVGKKEYKCNVDYSISPENKIWIATNPNNLIKLEL